MEDLYEEGSVPFEMDRAVWVRRGRDVAIIACGEMVKPAVDAADALTKEGISAAVLDMYCVKPLDTQAVLEAAQSSKLVVTVEEHAPWGGLGPMVDRVVSENCPRRVINLALPDEPVITGESKEVFAHYGLDATGISKTVADALRG